MAQIFISYSRVDLSFVERLYHRLQQMRPSDTIWYDQAPATVIGTDDWWKGLLDNIADSDIFIYVLTEESIRSEYCQAQLKEAQRLRKRRIGVQSRELVESATIPSDIHQYVDMKQGVNDEAITRLEGALNHQLSQVRKSRAKSANVTPKPLVNTVNDNTSETSSVDSSETEETYVKTSLADRTWWIVFAFIIGGIIAVFAPDINAWLKEVNPFQQQDTPEATEVVELATAVQTDIPESTPINATLTNTSSPTAQQTSTNEPVTPTESITNLPPPIRRAIRLANTRVESNSDWLPIVQDYDLPRGEGELVTMVLVPAGCFMMGGKNGNADEQPIHEQCFEKPFWIDKYEVTNSQYGSPAVYDYCLDDSSKSNQPRNCVNWLQARDFCINRGGRLPSESEWEYAARGPDNLVYPWGDEFISDNVVGWGNSNAETASVGSRQLGSSWVGAMDMSGNVWEWTNSQYQRYPYDPRDGRENLDDVQLTRVLRGGSFEVENNFLYAANRRSFLPSLMDDFIGFRCVRDISEEP